MAKVKIRNKRTGEVKEVDEKELQSYGIGEDTNILKQMGQYLIDPAIKATKLAEMTGREIGNFFDPQVRSLRKRADAGEILNDQELARLNQAAGLDKSGTFLDKLRYTPEEVQEKFGGETMGERFGQGFKEGSKAAAGVSTYFMPLSGTRQFLTGSKAITTLAPSLMRNVGDKAAMATIEGLFRGYSEDDATVGSTISTGIGSGIGGGIFALGTGMLDIAAKSFVKRFGDNEFSKKLVQRIVSPVKKGERTAEIDKAIKYTKKTLAEELFDETGGNVPTSGKQLAEFSNKKVQQYGKEIQGVMDKYGDTEIPIAPIKLGLKELRDEYADGTSAGSQRIVAEIDRRLKILDEKYPMDLTKKSTLKTTAPAKELWKSTKADEKTIKTLFSGKTIDDMTGDKAVTAIQSWETRKAIASKIPQLTELNQKYTTWKSLYEVGLDAADKGLNRQPTGFLAGPLTAYAAITGDFFPLIAGMAVMSYVKSPKALLQLANVSSKVGTKGSEMINKATNDKLLQFLTGAATKGTRQVGGFSGQELAQ